MTRLHLSLAALLSLSACATPDSDISVTRIDATTMRLSARESAFTNINELKNAVLLRAAQETLRHGRMTFRVEDPESLRRAEKFWAVGWPSVPPVTYEPGPGDFLIRMMSGPKQEYSSAEMFDAAKVICSLNASSNRVLCADSP
jgi:hypothetical protein